METLHGTCGLCVAQFGKLWLYVWIEMKEVVRDRWRALVSTVRNLRVPKMRGIS